MSSAQTEQVPSGWGLTTNVTEDSVIEKAFTRMAYTADDGTVVRIATVQEPNSFGGWGYLIWTVGSDAGELGLVETLDEAKELADDYMQTYECEN